MILLKFSFGVPNLILFRSKHSMAASHLQSLTKPLSLNLLNGPFKILDASLPTLTNTSPLYTFHHAANHTLPAPSSDRQVGHPPVTLQCSVWSCTSSSSTCSKNLGTDISLVISNHRPLGHSQQVVAWNKTDLYNCTMAYTCFTIKNTKVTQLQQCPVSWTNLKSKSYSAGLHLINKSDQIFVHNKYTIQPWWQYVQSAQYVYMDGWYWLRCSRPTLSCSSIMIQRRVCKQNPINLGRFWSTMKLGCPLH